MRIAFLTPEFPSEAEGRGVGTYLHRISVLLTQSGHEVDVFVSTLRPSKTLTYDGVCVHRVNWGESRRALRKIFYLWSRYGRVHSGRVVAEWILQARALAAELERRHSEAPFALVQSTDLLATGLFVGRRRNRIHVVRCSSAADLFNKIDGATSKQEWWRAYLERVSIKRADFSYAPSRYIADYFVRAHGINVDVVRPPRYLEIQSAAPPTIPLPSRFFFHFGHLSKRKGSDLLAQALPMAWRAAPDLSMVWSGWCPDQHELEHWRSLWGDRAKQVQITGPLPKAELYAVLKQADAAVLPSQVDNLPNAVIESLMLGIPVIGSRGASIDELVDEGLNGHLVDLGDVDELAQTLVKMWKGASPVRKGFEWNSSIADDMRPERAVANLIGLARS